MNTKQKALIAYLVIFLVGLMTGVLIKDRVLPTESSEIRTEWTERGRSGERPGWGNRERGERPGRELIRRHLSQRLALEEDQKDDFINKLHEYHSEIRDVIRQMREDEREVIRLKYQEFRSGMTDLLTEEQLQKLDAFAHPDSVRTAGFQRMRGATGADR